MKTNAEKMVSRIHQHCQHFEQKIKIWDEYDVDVYDSCLKNHDLTKTKAKQCEDYTLEHSPFKWAEVYIDYDDFTS